MADSDDDSIWIDVRPRLDDSAADSAVNKLRDKFSHAGDSLKDSLSTAFDSIGDHLGGVGGLGDKLHDTLAGALTGREWDNLGKQAGTALGQGVGEALKDITKGDFGNVFGEFKSVGDVLGGAVDKLSSKLDGLQKAGNAAGNVLSGNASGDDITDIIGGAKDLGFKIPGPVNNAIEAKKAIDKLNEHPGQAEDWLSGHIPGLGVLDNVINKGPQKVGETIHDWFTGKPASTPARDSASDKWASSVANEVDISATAATISAGSVSLGGSISLPGLGGTIHDALGTGSSGSGHSSSTSSSSGIARAGGDSSSMASLYSGPSVLGKGFATGGVIPGDSPGYDNTIGMLPGGGMVGLEGGEGIVRNSAMSRPGIAALVASLNQHYDEGTTNAGGQPQQQSIGHGSGYGITGGAIGAAEGAASAAAGAFSFGGGAIAAQLAEQEINLAVQKGGQAIATLAAAPFETFGLSGGQMGAPQVNPLGGWVGKVISGLVGQSTNLPNMAHSVQSPKQPNQQQQGDKDPGHGGETPTGPKGSKDDPMHVNVTNQPNPAQGAMTSGANFTAMAGIAPA